MDMAHKYRVRNFYNIEGNEGTIRLLKNRVIKRNLSDFIVLHGVPGTCKSALSFLLVKASHCDNLSPDGEPCGECKSCKAIEQGLYNEDRSALRGTNVYIYNMADTDQQDANIRSIISLIKAPNFHNNKDRFIIVNELHNCDYKKQKNFLVPFESIPEGVHVIVTTTDYLTRIDDGLRSRAKAYQLTKPSVEEAVNKLKQICDAEGYKVTKEKLGKLVRIKDCNMRECINALDDIFTDADSAWEMLLKNYTTALRELIDFVIEAKSGIIGLTSYISRKDNAVDFVKALPDTIYRAVDLKYVADQIVEPALRKEVIEAIENIPDRSFSKIIKSLTGIGHINDTEAKRILFVVGCDINEEIFRQVPLSDVQNSLDIADNVGKRNDNSGVVSYSADDCMVTNDESDGTEGSNVSSNAIMEFIQNDVGEVDVSDIEGGLEDE